MVEFATNTFDIQLISGIFTPFHSTNLDVKVFGNILNKDFLGNFSKGRSTASGTSIGGRNCKKESEKAKFDFGPGRKALNLHSENT